MTDLLTRTRKYVWHLSGLILLCLVSASIVQAAESSTSQVNAFFLRSIPGRYHDIEILFQRLKSGGANTIIARPLKKNGNIDAASLTNLIFISHMAGLRVYVVLPTRLDRRVLETHRAWEEIRYDLESGTLQATGLLNLADPQVVAHLVKRFKEVAAFSVDGILLDEDFVYESTEGVSPPFLREYTRIYGSSFAARKVFAKASPAITDSDIKDFDKSFWQWSELKRDAMVNAAQEIGKACRAVQGDIQFGIPLHVPGGETPQQALARFAYDMKAFRNLAIDFYWFELRSAEGAGQGGRSYKKDVEHFSRLVKSATAMQSDPAKMIIAIPATASRKVLPLFEIEDTTALAKQAGETTGIAYLMEQAAVPPPALTNKLFERQ